MIFLAGPRQEPCKPHGYGGALEVAAAVTFGEIRSHGSPTDRPGDWYAQGALDVL